MKLLFIWLLLLSHGLAFSQGVFIKVENNYSDEFVNFELEINSTLITFSDTAVVVEKSNNGLDSIKLIHPKGGWEKISYMILKADEEYVVSVNSCSFYEFKPLRNHIKGVAYYLQGTKSTRDSIRVYLGMWMQVIDSQDIKSKFTYIPSGMCQYASQLVGFSDPDQIYPQSKSYIHFLHGEKFLVENKNDRVVITFLGYIEPHTNFQMMDEIR